MHEVKDKDGIIEVIMSGDFDHKAAALMTADIMEKLNHYEEKGEPIYVVADMRQVKTISKDAYKLAAMSIRDTNQNKAAIFGAHKSWKMPLMETIINLSGKGDKVKFFDTRKEAFDWLKTDNS